MSETAIAKLRNPLRAVPEFTSLERHALDLWITNRGRTSYNDNRQTAINAHKEDTGLLTYRKVQKKVAELTRIEPLVLDMCVDSHVAFVGMWEKEEECPICHKSRYDAHGKPVKQWSTFLPGPQIQARWLSPQGAHDMLHREREMEGLLAELLSPEGLQRIKDLYHGTNFYERYQDGDIGKDDFVLIYSTDGAQLFEHKASNCWIYIWILVDKKYLLPGAIYPDSFNFPGFEHLSALAKEGLKREFVSRPYLLLVEADAVAAPEMHGWCPHGSKQACRRRCGAIGRRKPGLGHYYAADMRPDHYNEEGCSHDDHEPSELLPPQTEEETTTEYNLLGIPRAHRSDIPDIFAGDIMHALGLNIPPHYQQLLRGIIPCDEDLGDKKERWTFADLGIDGNWEKISSFVEFAQRYIPTCFGRIPRSPARKINSGYKCEEFLTWFYGLFPAHAYGVLKDGRWEHLCDLVAGVRTAFLRGATPSQLRESHTRVADWKANLEYDYAQLKISRLHFMPQCTHAVLHDSDDYFRNGPLIASSQFACERYIGILGGELNQPSNIYGNITERALRFAQLNAMLAMYPDLDRSPPPISRRPGMSYNADQGFHLLHPRQHAPSSDIDEKEEEAILAWLQSVAGENNWETCWEDAHKAVRKWSRCYLPNGQVARSRMKEIGRRGITRTSRNVKYMSEGSLAFGEVYYYFSLPITPGPRAERRAAALVSRYGEPDPDLLRDSRGVVWAARHLGDAALSVIDVRSIQSVVGMIPHDFNTPSTNGVETLWFVLEKLGREVGWMTDIDDDEDNGDDIDEI
ncbi:hypothetical protein PENSPDRAFT_744460 [Peniophora sp. CONT]|nr:hypothetical protein PENSPDRAFT_744460 [Peniophora sp. CONT]